MFHHLIMIAISAALLISPSVRAQDLSASRNRLSDDTVRLSQLIEDAKKEGSLSYWDGVIQAQTNDRLVAAFRNKYSLPPTFKVNYTLSATSALITKIEQELAADKITVDVAAVAAPAWAFEMFRNGSMFEYASPEYKFYGQAFQKGMGKDKFFAFNGAYFFAPMWNADNLKFEGKSWRDVIGAVPVGRASVGDAAKSMPYLVTFIGLEKVLGMDFAPKLAAMKPTFILRSEQSMGRLASGEDLMSFTGMPTRAYQFNRLGAKLKFMIPKEGVILLPQSMFILAKAPHPNAAKLWLDFILSQDGQRILVEEEALVSGRAGFKSPLPGYAPSMENLKMINLDWSVMTTDFLVKERLKWVQIFN